MADGNDDTYTIFVDAQPDDMVYDIVALPVDTPLTIPDTPTLAMPGSLLLHEPPPVAQVYTVVEPEQTLLLPLIAIGVLFTVTTDVAEQPLE